jgi:glucagon
MRYLSAEFQHERLFFSCSLETADSLLEDLVGVPNMKRHSEGTFSNDYSKYQEERMAQDFVQWLMNSKRSG